MKHTSFSKLVFLVMAIVLGFSALGEVAPARAAGTCYVNDNASGLNNGISWIDAYTSLQSAITDSCTEIWVASGTYKPHATDRTATFQLENGVAVYGGFDGLDDAVLTDRNPAANPTLLSGDIGAVGNNTDNSYHVVKGASGATLDGFTITGGYANGGALPDNVGGGILNDWVSSATYSNLVIQGNYAGNAGGGVDNHSSTPTFTNITVANNSTSGSAYGGGGMFNWQSNAIVTNATFVGNSSTYGGGMYNDYWSIPTLTNVTFTSNTASSNGGGIYNNQSSNAVIRNTILWGNSTQIANTASTPTVTYSVVQGGYPGTGNLSTNPNLGTLGYYGGATQTVPLLPGSSAINAGNAAACTTGSDQRGVGYVGVCDIGAFEYYSGIYYVKPTASGMANCAAWNNACTLQSALSWSSSGDEIWVAAGTYKPTTGTDRTATFQLKSGVAVYGGFAGTETARDERNIMANVATLSGDIGTRGIATDNSLHVVTGVTGATLDGFTITGGYAQGTYPNTRAAGCSTITTARRSRMSPSATTRQTEAAGCPIIGIVARRSRTSPSAATRPPPGAGCTTTPAARRSRTLPSAATRHPPGVGCATTPAARRSRTSPSAATRQTTAAGW